MSGAANGGSSAGGAMQSGGSDADGGDPADGGSSADGGSNDGTGGDEPSDGGASSGGAASGGASSGGAPTGPALVENMESGSTYSHSPFNGSWKRYAQADVVWGATNVSGMFVLREDSETDHVLEVVATFPEDDWGVDIAVSLKGTKSIDLSGFKSLRFEATRGSDLAGDVLRVALEDEASHRGSTLCSADGLTGTNCDRHVEALYTPSLSDGEWATFEFDLDSDTFDDCGPGCSRTTPLDLTKVYAIHFKMDPDEGVDVDFSIDNIYFDR